MQKLPSVLLVDDDTTTNFLHQHLLQKLAVADDIRVATDGEQALSLLTQPLPYRPALLLLDVKMPVMDGIEFLEAFRQLPAAQRAATVVIMLTTSVAATDLTRLHELPVAGLISKPLTRDKVDELLRRHFGRALAAPAA